MHTGCTYRPEEDHRRTLWRSVASSARFRNFEIRHWIPSHIPTSRFFIKKKTKQKSAPSHYVYASVDGEFSQPDDPLLENTVVIAAQDGCFFNGTNSWYFSHQDRGDTEYIKGIVQPDGVTLSMMEGTVQHMIGDIVGVIESADDGSGILSMTFNFLGKSKDDFGVLAFTETLWNTDSINLTDPEETPGIYGELSDKCEDKDLVGMWISDPYSEFSVSTDASYYIVESGLMLNITSQEGCSLVGSVRSSFVSIGMFVDLLFVEAQMNGSTSDGVPSLGTNVCVCVCVCVCGAALEHEQPGR